MAMQIIPLHRKANNVQGKVTDYHPMDIARLANFVFILKFILALLVTLQICDTLHLFWTGCKILLTPSPINDSNKIYDMSLFRIHVGVWLYPPLKCNFSPLNEDMLTFYFKKNYTIHLYTFLSIICWMTTECWRSKGRQGRNHWPHWTYMLSGGNMHSNNICPVLVTNITKL